MKVSGRYEKSFGFKINSNKNANWLPYLSKFVAMNADVFPVAEKGHPTELDASSEQTLTKSDFCRYLNIARSKEGHSLNFNISAIY